MGQLRDLLDFRSTRESIPLDDPRVAGELEWQRSRRARLLIAEGSRQWSATLDAVPHYGIGYGLLRYLYAHRDDLITDKERDATAPSRMLLIMLREPKTA